MSQRELVEAAMRGDHEAFEAVATAASARLYAVARLILRDVDLAEDALQEALVRMWRSLPTLRDPASFDGWAYRLVVNACADVGRDRRRLRGQVRLIQREPVAVDDLSASLDRDQLERGFRHLRPEHRAVLVLHYYAGLSALEVADALGIPVGTAKSRIHYGTEVLRASLDAEARGAVTTKERSA